MPGRRRKFKRTPRVGYRPCTRCLYLDNRLANGCWLAHPWYTFIDEDGYRYYS